MMITVCDDERAFIDRIVELITLEFKKADISHTVDTFDSGESLIEHLRHVNKSDLIILDYLMFGISGIDVAHRIRETGSRAKIVFISSVMDAAVPGYEINVFRYILKDSMLEANFHKCLQKIIDEYKAPSETFLYRIGENQHTVLAGSILYFESQLRKIRMVTSNQDGTTSSTEFYALLSDLEMHFGTLDFIRIHKGYLVNPKHLVSMHEYEAAMSNGDILPISARRYTKVHLAYLRWEAEQDA
jgi:Response regulator of the LytR/AlgR family